MADEPTPVELLQNEIVRRSLSSDNMPTAKKDKDKPKKEKKKPEPESDDDDDDDNDGEEEEEEVESAAVKAKRQRGRSSFLKLLRKVLSFVPLALVLSKQPFTVRPRGNGVNAAKLRPLELAISGAVHWAVDSPTVMRNPKFGVYLNETGRVLLTPHEYVITQQSKRAMPNEKTMKGAYKKADGRFKRLIDREPQVLEMIRLPQPNLLAIGSYVLTGGALLCPFISSYMEYLIVGGCIAILQGGRQLGMEPQPELYVAAVTAGLALMAMEAAGKVSAPAKKKRR